MKAYLIYNNSAANKRAEKHSKHLFGALKSNGIQFIKCEAANSGETIQKVSSADLSDFDLIIAAGGDGTLFTVLNGIMNNPSRGDIPMAVIPVGTGNAFARELGILSDDITGAVEAIKNGKLISVDIAKFSFPGGNYYFLNILGIGFVTDVARTAHNLKALGKLSYTLGVLYHTLFLKHFDTQLEHDGVKKNRKAVFIEISNTKYTGRDFLMAPDAKFDDGLLDITIMLKSSRFRLLSGLPKIFTGSHVKMKEVETIKAKKISVECGVTQILTPDGEILGKTPVNIECVNNAVKFYSK